MRLRLIVMAVFMGVIWPQSVHADSTVSTGLELSELFPDPASPLVDEHDEFTEVHNTSTDDLDISGYSLKIGTHVYTFKTTTVPADGYVTVTSAESTLTLPNTTGTMQLLAPNGGVIDSTTYSAVKTGWSWAKIDGAWGWTNQVTQGDDNAASIIAATPTITPTPTVTSSDTATSTSGLISSTSPVRINELLPDPAAPLSDDKDEFIELINPSADAVDLTGYTLKVGKTLSSHYALSGKIQAGGYVVYKSAQTHLQLANAGSSVALFDASGSQVDATVSYPAATAGSAWARSDNGWGWTTTATPGSPNVITAPVTVVKPTKASSSATKSASRTTSTKAAVAKKITSKAASTAKAAASKTVAVATAATRGSGMWLLLLLGGLTIGFVMYEFRHDVLDLYYRTRSYLRRRGQARS